MSKKMKRKARKRFLRVLADLGIIVNLIGGLLNVIILIIQLAG